MSKQGGITLIGLAITIAVLLILAGISIVMLTGDNGIIKEANNAKEQVEISAEKENIDISVIEVLGQKTNGIIEKSDKDKFEENLRKNYNNQKIDVSVLENQDPYIFEVKYLQTKRSYYVTVDGDVSESIGKKLVIEYKTSKGNLITKKLHEYTKETITIGKLELSEEIKKKNNYEFSKAEIVKVDGSITNVNIIDKVTLDESINKITIIYSQKEIQTLTINPNGGNVGETSKKGAEGEQVQIPIPAPPSGNKITLNANGGTVSQTTLKTAYTFDRWNLSGGGTISGNTYTFGNQNGTVTALYIHRGITLPEPTRDGYIFKGWYTSSTGGTKVGDAGSIYAPIENITIYARWQDEVAPTITKLTAGITSVAIEATDSGTGINGYAISTNAMPSNFVTVGKTNDLYITVSGLNEGTTYYVWVKDEAGNQSEYKTVTTATIPRYTLTINPNGGNVGEISKKGAEGEQVQIPIPAPPSGNKITLNANGGTVSQTTLKTAYTFDRWNLSGGGTISGNTYTFGNQNGTVTALYIHRGITLPEPTRDGYIFKGWYTSSTGGTKVGDAGSIYAPIENITIYARWEKVPDLILDTNVFFEPDITTWTNKDVTVKARTTVQGYQIQLAAGNPEIESNWITTNSMTLKENGTVYARLTNGNLYGGYASYNVTNIDKVAPRQFQKDMTTIMADSISPDDTIHLQLNNIGDTESGVAKIKCYYRSEKENSYMFYLAYDRVPINGSERGKTDAYWSIDCKVKSSTFDGSWSQNNKVYMYAEVYDVAGNISRTWMASIDSDRKTTSYTEYE